MYKFLNIVLISLFIVTKSYSEIIKKVEIVNNDRITKETILVFSNIEIGKDYDANELDQIVKIYLKQIFSDLSINLNNGVLTIDVKENKIIQLIEINGKKV